MGPRKNNENPRNFLRNRLRACKTCTEHVIRRQAGPQPFIAPRRSPNRRFECGCKWKPVLACWGAAVLGAGVLGCWGAGVLVCWCAGAAVVVAVAAAAAAGAGAGAEAGAVAVAGAGRDGAVALRSRDVFRGLPHESD